jgi:hypothetical protein
MNTRNVIGQRVLPLFGEATIVEIAEVPKLRRLSPGRNAPKHDLVSTPQSYADTIVDYFQPRGRLLDAARGNGAFFTALRRYSSDVDWCEIDEGRDFLLYRRPVDWIVTNPPWSKIRPFTLHAMTLAPNIVFLVTENHLTTVARRRDMKRRQFGIECMLEFEHPPKPWPRSGFQLAAILLRKNATSSFVSAEGAVPLREVINA